MLTQHQQVLVPVFALASRTANGAAAVAETVGIGGSGGAVLQAAILDCVLLTASKSEHRRPSKQQQRLVGINRCWDYGARG